MATLCLLEMIIMVPAMSTYAGFTVVQVWATYKPCMKPYMEQANY
jgi:hypothetical protein